MRRRNGALETIDTVERTEFSCETSTQSAARRAAEASARECSDLTRVCVLAVSLMLKNRYDAMPVDEGAHVEAVQAGYDRVRKLRAILGPVSEAEIEAATALWEETAS